MWQSLLSLLWRLTGKPTGASRVASPRLTRLSLVHIGVWGGILALSDYFGISQALATSLSDDFQKLSTPLVSLAWRINQVVVNTQSLWADQQELAALKMQYSLAVSQLQELERLRTENRALRSILENTDRPLVQTFVTSPIVSFAQPAVAVGSVHGVTTGSAVVGAGSLIGIITTVAPTQSRVTLLPDLTEIAILAQTESGVQGLVRGRNGVVWLDEVRVDARVLVGEKVVTVGQMGIPAGLVIGTVAISESLPQDSVQKIQIQQLVSFYSIPVVEVY